jgi:hypothetical protein
MTIDEKIQNRLVELLKQGDAVLATRRSPPANVIGPDSIDHQLAFQWSTSAQSLLTRVFGPDSQHYKNFTLHVGKDWLGFSDAYRAQGVLKAAQDDYANGQLVELRKLVEAEVFDDFLEQAEHLLSSGYYQPAGVIAGCVLEDGLRKLCGKRGIPITDRPKLDTMNAELAKAGVYNKLVQKRITTIADLRNKAAHGEWTAFGEEDVKEMVSAVRRFMEEFLA